MAEFILKGLVGVGKVCWNLFICFLIFVLIGMASENNNTLLILMERLGARL